MENMQQYQVTVQGAEYAYPTGTTFGDIAAAFQSQYAHDILLVNCDGKLCELHKQLERDCTLKLITAEEKPGMQTYERSTVLLLLKAFYDVAGEAQVERVCVEFSMSHGLFVRAKGRFTLDQPFLNRVEARMRELVSQAVPIVKQTIPTDAAVTLFRERKLLDKSQLLSFRIGSTVNLYSIGDFSDYFYGYMVPHTGYLKWFALELFEDGFEAVFIGSGAGLPKFMNIPGEAYKGVYSANEFLTRSNLMKAYKEGYDTPVYPGKVTIVVGGGNVAMDAARTAKRLGAEVHLVYRRSKAEMPARVEEVEHAKEEGIEFHFMTNPIEIVGDEQGWVKAVKCVRMELGEPDASGRRSPIEVKGSEHELKADCVVMALGTAPNKLITDTTEGLDSTDWGGIKTDEHAQTSRQGIFAGGDAVMGAATVILAMGAGKKAAKSIDEYLQSK